VRPPLVLASASPRRLELLARIGLVPDEVLATDIDETEGAHETPTAAVRRLAAEKARAAMRLRPDAVVLAADTLVAVGRRILPKANDAAEVARCLTLLSGRAHRVLTAVGLGRPDGHLAVRMAATRLKFARLDAATIAAYAAGGEGIGKAGGYAIQGHAEAFVLSMTGTHSTVVGLPLHIVRPMLRGAGIAVA
jgi:septum formation protein